MREFVIENGIVIDDVDSVVEGIRNITGKSLSDAETLKKFITKEKATKYYIDKKCVAKMQPDKDSVYLWLDSGFVDRYGNSVMISLLNDNYGGYTGHYFGTMDVLANTIKNYFPKNSKDINRNLCNLKNKYQNKIADRSHRHIESEQEYLIMLCNGESTCSEIEELINGLNVNFEEFEEVHESSCIDIETSKSIETGINMTFKEEEITIGLLLDAIDEMQDYINDLLEELKKSNENKIKLQQLEQRNKDLEQALVNIRAYNSSNSTSDIDVKKGLNGHDLLGKKGKILVLGATALDEKTMNGIAKQYGFMKNDFDYMLDYDKIKSFTGRSNKLGKYSAIILGACPHKVQNLGDWSSLIDKCKNMEGMPIAVDARSRSGELKVTKESFRQALIGINCLLQNNQ